MDRKHSEECKPAIEEAARRGLEHFRQPLPGSDTDNDAANSEQQAAVDAGTGPA